MDSPVVKSTIEKLKKETKKIEKEEEEFFVAQNKREEILTELKCALRLINEEPKIKLANISQGINNWIESSKIEMEVIQNAVDALTTSMNIDKVRKKKFVEKVHIYRDSQLSTVFYHDKGIKSTYFLLLNLFLWLLLWVTISDWQWTSQIFTWKVWASKLTVLMGFAKIWLFLCFYSSFIVFYVQLIQNLAKKMGRISYIPILTVYFIYQSIIYITTVLYISQPNDYGFPMRFFIGMEMARISMKIHGYFREKILFGLKEYHMDYAKFSLLDECELDNIQIVQLNTELKQFYYYFFCPSLIYRDKYPRTTSRNWSLLIAHLFNCIICIVFFFILLRYICEPYFNFSKIKDYYSPAHFLYDSLRFAIPATCFLVVSFFFFLHSWMNLWSEIILHGDRRFYEDWWNCINFEEYYRKWNMIVHEWLYYYIYNDVIRFSLGHLKKFHAKILVFGISVFIHEMIITIGLGFFYPILSLFFGGPGIIFTYIKPTQKEFNIIFWIKMLFGEGIMLVLYLREFTMRDCFRHIGLYEPWHDWVPKIVLMYFEPYKGLIQQSSVFLTN